MTAPHLNGTRPDGQQAVRAALPLTVEGPVLEWPQRTAAEPPAAPEAALPARRRPWPLALIATPAAVAIWSGWVGLGGMCGFGLVQPLPGIASWHLDTAITLPVGIEAYGAYALHAWLAAREISDRARSFARRSAIGAGLLGCLGQVAFHLMAAAGWKRAPWYVVMLVACLPVVTLFFAATLTHLSRARPGDRDSAPEDRSPVIDLEAIESAHAAELGTLETAHAAELESLRETLTETITARKAELAEALTRVSDLETELAAARERKNDQKTASETEKKALRLLRSKPHLRQPRMGAELARLLEVSEPTGRRLHSRLVAQHYPSEPSRAEGGGQ